MTATSSVEAIVPVQPERTLLQRLFSPLGVTAVAVIHFSLGLLDGSVSQSLFRLLIPLMLIIAIIVAAAIVSLFIVIAGWLCGMRFHRIVLGPLNLGFTDGRLSANVNQKWDAFYGSVSMKPGNRELTWTRSMVYLGAGTVAALIVTLFSVWLSVNYGGWPDTDSFFTSHIAPLMFMLLPASLLILYFEYSAGGTTILQWRSEDPDEKRRFGAFITLNLLTQTGTRPRDLPAHLIDELGRSNPESPLLIAAPAFRYVRALDLRDYDGAERTLDQLEENLQSYPGDQQPGRLAGITQWVSLYHERAYFSARYRGDAVTALNYLGFTDWEQPLRVVTLRVTAAVLEAAGDRETAVECVREAFEELENLPDASSWRVPFERDLLDDILRESRTESLKDDAPGPEPVVTSEVPQ